MQTLSPFTVLLCNLPIRARLALTRLVQSQPALRVLSADSSPDELSIVARRLRPDLVVVADSQLSALESLSRQYPVPVLLYTSTLLLQGVLQQTARWGVYNAIGQLPAIEGMALEMWQEDVLRKIRASLPQCPLSGKSAVNNTQAFALPRGIVVIGASTGGVRAVEQVVRGLTPALGWSIIVAVHLPAHFTQALVERLRRLTLLPVEAAEEGSTLEAGKITVVPGERNMVVQAGFAGSWPIWQLVATNEPSPCFDDPSIDLLMCSAAQVAGSQVVGAVLTGLGHDGTLGARAIRQRGGVVAVQDKASAEAFSMPNSVIQAGCANEVLALSDLASYINDATAKVPSGRRQRVSSSAQTVYR